MTCGIYKIQNTVTHDEYVGQSVNIEKRITEHARHLRCGDHDASHMQRAFNKYGNECFVDSVLLQCESCELTRYEQWYLDSFQFTYNANRAAEKPPQSKKGRK